jgi:hypothetical protein
MIWMVSSEIIPEASIKTGRRAEVDGAAPIRLRPVSSGSGRAAPGEAASLRGHLARRRADHGRPPAGRGRGLAQGDRARLTAAEGGVREEGRRGAEAPGAHRRERPSNLP